MSINTQKLLDEIERRYAALDSTSSLSEIQRVSELNTRKDGPILTGAIQYSSLNQANAPSGFGDSAKVGEIFFVADRQLDSNGRFYFRSQEGFINLKTALDSSENASITAAAAAAAAGGGGSTSFTGQAFFEGYNIQGDTYGYRYGGSSPPYNIPYNTDRFSFTSDGNSAAVPALTGSPTGAGTPDRTGYTSHQYLGISSQVHFPFANEDGWTATDVTAAPTGYSYFGHTQASATHVYRLGGASPLNVNVIDKFPVAAIASGAQAVDVGNLSVNMGYSMGGEGASSETHCYRVGGFKVPGYNAGPIQKVAYASDGDATQPGNPLSGGYNQRQNCSSPSHGYAMGGAPNGGAVQDLIEKWSFTSDGNATDVGDLQEGVHGNAGATSTTHGYRTGGHKAFSTSSTTDRNIIEKFAFASDGNATDVGNLSVTWAYGAGANE